MRLTKYLLEKKAFAKNIITMVDAGASGGFPRWWEVYGNQGLFLGFDPHEKEGEKEGRRMYRAVLGRQKERRKFFIMKHAHSSSLYPPDPAKVKRYSWESSLTIAREIEVDVTDLDSFLAEHQIPYVDFLKMDVEGAELDILQGAQRTLDGVMGLLAEFVFHPVRLGQPVFRDIDAFLCKCGFELYHIKTSRHFRSTLSVCPYAENRGQMIGGEVVYIRPIADEIMATPNKWNAARVTRAVSLLDVMQLPDCAIEVVQRANEKSILNNRVREIYEDLLTPPYDGEMIGYKEYWRRLRDAVDTNLGARDIAHQYKKNWSSHI